jgi:lysyl-tRNA synthetase class 2
MWLSVLAGCIALAAAVTHPGGVVPWIALAVTGLNGLSVSLLERRSGATAVGPPEARDRHDQLAAVRQLIECFGDDSIAPFIVRPDKAYAFAAGAVLAYRVFGRTAVVSGDPVGGEEAAAAVLEAFVETAHSRGWEVVVYGASRNRLETYHRLGFRSVCVGEEAVKRPDDFSLEGRRVRKLRQSVHRIQRRGWRIEVYNGAEIEPETEAEINALEARWRAQQSRLLGFAMSMGRFEAGVGPADLYLLARSPDGGLAATMRFIGHRGKLSLDTMRRVGETPNGLNEALVCRALEVARQRGITQVSLNYAGLAHLIRPSPRGGLRRRMINLGLALLSRQFQMERLVRFNEKFSPEWRPRYLVYPTRRSLPRAVYRVLQAEGYISPPHHALDPRQPITTPRPPRALRSAAVDASRR